MGSVIVRRETRLPYLETWHAMQRFTDTRGPETRDEIWLLEHPPVFTLGQAGRREHILQPGNIPVIPIDRGGQVTYHGPGQLVVYILLDLKRLEIGVKKLVNLLEQAVLEFLAGAGVIAQRKDNAPGIYVDGEKIAALGLRIRNGCCFHGLALNVDMDLEPFQRINPCGYQGLQVTQLKDWVDHWPMDKVREGLLQNLLIQLGVQSLDENGSSN